jgi:uncharacterized protein YxeA
MNYIIIITSILLAIIAGILLFRNHKRRKSKLDSEQPEWQKLIQYFKSKTPEIKNLQMLEEYLLSIKDEVKEYETDYSFLVAFNSQIREIRERLKQKI